MNKIYGVSFKENGKVYYFKTEKLDIEKNVPVIVETEKGMQYGVVVAIIKQSSIDIDFEKLKEIIRISTKEDKQNHLNNLKAAERALENARTIVEELNLEMSLLDANFTFDKRQLLFNFTADERVDFRELAKKLAGIYKTRIELRQIGARDKAKEIGGLGQCGRCLCCKSFLNHMEGVSMSMAKNQNIALNPNKINGQCGRLLCCLTYENDEYSRCQRGMPDVGQIVTIDQGKGRVVSVDVLNRKYKIDIDGTKVEVELPVCEKTCNK